MSDIIIIGGGIAGISAAARLSEQADVTVLEAEDQLAYHASGRSAAVFIKDYGNPTIRALNIASLPYLRAENEGFLSPRGMMLLAKPNERAAFSDEAAEFGLQPISVSEAIEKVPLINQRTLGYAAYRSDVYDIDTDKLLQDFLRKARNQGAKIHVSHPVKALNFCGGKWQVKTQKGDFQANILINAAGAWADHIAKMASVPPLGLIAYRRSIARLPVPGGYDPTSWPVIDEIGEAWYAKPDAGQLIVSPADEDPLPAQDAWADDMILAEGLARFEAMITHPITRPSANWAGLRTFAPDRALVIGSDPKSPSFFWLAGQGGYGFQTAAASSQLIADLVLDQRSDLPKDIQNQLSPNRFHKRA
jgi:glycine/D-amino acid oxidase-like deaminating enzyme